VRALILAAGRGLRLGDAAGGVPKPLVEVGGITPLEHAAGWVAGVRPTGIWVNVHIGAELVMQRLGAFVAGVPVRYVYEPDLLGTAGAWTNLVQHWTGTSLVIYGDNIMRFDLDALVGAHRAAGAIATIAVFDAERHGNTGTAGGRVEMSQQRVTRFVEGGADGLINAGAYCVEAALRERLPSGFLDFGRDVLPDLARRGELAGHLIEDGAFCYGVDTPERLGRARRLSSARLVAG
jgi:mannose-1-phosphate guanylyltransferase